MDAVTRAGFAGLRKVGGRDAGFEADKKSFISVPVSVTEVKLFDYQVEGIKQHNFVERCIIFGGAFN